MDVASSVFDLHHRWPRVDVLAMAVSDGHDAQYVRASKRKGGWSCHCAEGGTETDRRVVRPWAARQTPLQFVDRRVLLVGPLNESVGPYVHNAG